MYINIVFFPLSFSRGENQGSGLWTLNISPKLNISNKNHIYYLTCHHFISARDLITAHFQKYSPKARKSRFKSPSPGDPLFKTKERRRRAHSFRIPSCKLADKGIKIVKKYLRWHAWKRVNSPREFRADVDLSSWLSVSNLTAF